MLIKYPYSGTSRSNALDTRINNGDDRLIEKVEAIKEEVLQSLFKYTFPYEILKASTICRNLGFKRRIGFTVFKNKPKMDTETRDILMTYIANENVVVK